MTGDSMRIETAEQRLERLAFQLALLQADCERADARELALRERIDDQQQEMRRLREREASLEQRLGQLAQLLAAVLQLHAARLPGDVFTAIKEIVANLVGSEEMGIFARAEDGSLKLVDGIGPGLAELAVDHYEILDHTLTSGAPHFQDGVPVACIPLRWEQRVLAVIAVFRLLPQKPALDAGDLDLFDLLATHAGLALAQVEQRACP